VRVGLIMPNMMSRGFHWLSVVGCISDHWMLGFLDSLRLLLLMYCLGLFVIYAASASGFDEIVIQ
jgi:hypothetical protein